MLGWMQSSYRLAGLRFPAKACHRCRLEGRAHGREGCQNYSLSCVTTVQPPSSDHLKLYQAPVASTPADPSRAELPSEVEQLCHAFSEVTGYRLRYVETDEPSFDPTLEWSAPVNPGVGASPGQLRMDRLVTPRHRSQADRDQAAERLLDSLAQLISGKNQASTSLVEREAELATCVPVIPHSRESAKLAERLRAVLQGGAESLDCQAAGVYLLDDATSQLKLRAMWGLCESRLTDPPRPLAAAIADLEALAGHAVVLENDLLFDSWQVPESCAAAVCVPLATPTTILGTLWLFSAQARDFNSQETNLVEILAGRIAAELERDILLREGRQNRSAKHQLAEAAELVNDSLPNIPPTIEGWDIAARVTAPTDSDIPLRQFYDWSAGADDSLDLVLAGVNQPGLSSTLKAAELRAAWRAEIRQQDAPAALVDRLATSLATDFSANRESSLAHIQIAAEQSMIRFSTLGEMGVLLVRDRRASWLSQTKSDGLSSAPRASGNQEVRLARGDMLIFLVSDGAIEFPSDSLLEEVSSTLNSPSTASAESVASRLVARIADSPVTNHETCRGVLVLRAR